MLLKDPYRGERFCPCPCHALARDVVEAAIAWSSVSEPNDADEYDALARSCLALRDAIAEKEKTA